METIAAKIHSAVPVVATEDIEKSLAYYTTVLCFEFDFMYGEPPVYAGVKSGDAEIYFTADQHSSLVIKKEKLNPEIFIWTPDADTLFEIHRKNGAEIIEPVSDRPWRSKQYVIKDINGYYLKFAQPM